MAEVKWIKIARIYSTTKKYFLSISRVNGKEYYNYSVYECEPLNKTFDCVPNKINVSGEFNPNVPNNDMPF